MPESTKKRRPASTRGDTKAAPAPRKSARSKGSTRSKAPVPPPAAAAGPLAAGDEPAFIEALVESGQAARLDKDGKLPAGATHKIVEDDQGTVRVVRRRFSMT